MTDSIALGPDGYVNHTLAVLRGGTSSGDLTQSVEFMPGVQMHADPEMNMAGRYDSPNGRMLELQARPERDGAWNGLHLAFPASDLGPHGALGFVMRASAAEQHVIRACIRSGTEDGFQDCFFDKHILLRAEESSHVDALAVHQRTDLPLHAPWRELILFLPATAFTMSIHDFRVFLV